jgi:uncharacterized protein (TIGR00369 family)
MDLKLGAADIEQLIRKGLPVAGENGIAVEEVRSGYARIRFPFREGMLRPGGVISGPTLMAAADTAMYACVMAHVGPELMAVTTDMTLHFVNKAVRGDVVAEASLLKLGRRLVVMEARVLGGDGRLAAHVTGTYARPS